MVVSAAEKQPAVNFLPGLKGSSEWATFNLKDVPKTPLKVVESQPLTIEEKAATELKLSLEVINEELKPSGIKTLFDLIMVEVNEIFAGLNSPIKYENRALGPQSDLGKFLTDVVQGGLRRITQS